MNTTWKNDYVFTEFICPRCQGTEHKQLVEEWNDTKIISYYPDHYFCCDCGVHNYFKSKSYA
jgi:hypothetical protein